MKRRTATIALLSVLMFAPLSFAADFPQRPIKIIVPFPAGGASDFLTRVVAEEMAKGMGVSVVTENRPGGGSLVGTLSVLKTAPDGYTLLLVANSFLLNSRLRAKPPYDAMEDFVPVSFLARSPQIFAVRQDHPARTLQEFLEQARSRPGTLTYGTNGPGTAQHVAGEMLKKVSRVDLMYVPYPGGAPTITSLLGGHIDLVIVNHGDIASQLKAGSARALATGTARRVEGLPAVPTVAESGFPGFEISAWFGFVAPQGTPQPIVDRLGQQVARALSLPEVRARLSNLSMELVGSNGSDFGAFMRGEIAGAVSVAQEAGVRLE